MKGTTLKRSLLLAALAALAATVPASATVKADCTSTGFRGTLFNYDPAAKPVVNIRLVNNASGEEVSQFQVTVTNGTTTFDYATTIPVVKVIASWGGPTRPADTNSVLTQTSCRPVDPTPPEPTPDGPGDTPETPGETPGGTPGGNPPPPNPKTCAALSKAGIKTRIKFGCATPPKPKVCPVGYKKVTKMVRVKTKAGKLVWVRKGACFKIRIPEVTG